MILSLPFVAFTKSRTNLPSFSEIVAFSLSFYSRTLLAYSLYFCRSPLLLFQFVYLFLHLTAICKRDFFLTPYSLLLCICSCILPFAELDLPSVMSLCHRINDFFFVAKEHGVVGGKRKWKKASNSAYTKRICSFYTFANFQLICSAATCTILHIVSVSALFHHYFCSILVCYLNSVWFHLFHLFPYRFKICDLTTINIWVVFRFVCVCVLGGIHLMFFKPTVKPHSHKFSFFITIITEIEWNWCIFESVSLQKISRDGE